MKTEMDAKEEHAKIFYPFHRRSSRHGIWIVYHRNLNTTWLNHLLPENQIIWFDSCSSHTWYEMAMIQPLKKYVPSRLSSVFVAYDGACFADLKTHWNGVEFSKKHTLDFCAILCRRARTGRRANPSSLKKHLSYGTSLNPTVNHNNLCNYRTSTARPCYE